MSESSYLPTRPILKSTFSFAHPHLVAFDTHRDIREHPHITHGAFDRSDLATDSVLSRGQLFRRESHAG